MLIQILVCCVIMVINAMIHAGGMSVGLRFFVLKYLPTLETASILTRSSVVAALILVMFVTTLIEASVWAATYTLVGAIPEFQKALYFSTVTYTTLGYGDIVLAEPWRLLSALQAASGIIMFGWTTALIVVAIQLVSQSLKQLKAMDS